ncbi:MAG TPA: hypothetical protein VKA26_02550 [Ignavibacteriaceae bacterium]|nr:hypothetical protein [Ignavibacteriaceae bacterium]
MTKAHSFHIPVMGIGYTIETPLKVSQFGIDSVISLVDDILLEKLRKMYCAKYEIPYTEITKATEDFRAKRITSYLNLIQNLAEKRFEKLKETVTEKENELQKFFDLLPEQSELKKEFHSLLSRFNLTEIKKWLNENLSMGSIDVNIMTKLDKDNYSGKEKLPVEYNDAHAALRGFAKSELKSSIVFSAGMNPRLYSYLEQFEDFYPDENGIAKKRIILKVSDYRSAFIQGKFLANKGLWVSEYRIESGLNCGGHAFATDGFLMGPILAEFKEKREELIKLLNEIYKTALSKKNRSVANTNFSFNITAQGGVGTAEEHQFLIDHYGVDSVGWGTPFLLVPEATTVDEATLAKLADAKEADLYLSNISPLGVPFNSLRGNTKDLEKLSNLMKGRPGSSCPKEYVAINNKEFTEKNICTASRQYQYLKLNELKTKSLSLDEHQISHDKIVEKSCICVGLGTSALLANNMDTKIEGDGVSICPGPNLAYFSKIMSLKEMTSHIYGRINVINRTDRPHMFIKELKIYIDYLKDKFEETKTEMSEKQEKYLLSFIENLKEGINYYYSLFTGLKDKFEDTRTEIINELNAGMDSLHLLIIEIEKFSVAASEAE